MLYISRATLVGNVMHLFGFSQACNSQAITYVPLYDTLGMLFYLFLVSLSLHITYVSFSVFLNFIDDQLIGCNAVINSH